MSANFPRRAGTAALNAGLAVALLGLAGVSGCSREPPAAPKPAAVPNVVTLSAEQAAAVTVAEAGTRPFTQERAAVGSIDFDENRTVAVYSPYAGRVVRALVDVGDGVHRGQVLYTIDSPDLLQAESTLIAAAANAELTRAALERAKDLYEHEGLAQKDYQQAVSDEMAAAGALATARDAVRLFGKSDAEVDAIIKSRHADSILVIPSPIDGRIATRAVQPGLYLQPGNPPPPFTVAALGGLWMIAAVPESDLPLVRVGQPMTVRVAALGEREFSATVKTIGANVDPTTHTTMVRAEVPDPKDLLRPGMLATFRIRVADPVETVALPQAGVVREGDGSYSAWVTTDGRRFERRAVRIGLQEDGYDQILEGVRAGERAVTRGAILLSNILYGSQAGD